MGTQRPDQTEIWTNEKHLSFLNSIEASFVRSMFENNNESRRPLRLDRYIPDSCESTLDSMNRPRKTSHNTSRNSDSIMVPPTPRGYSSQIFTSSSRDQVVPKFTGCKDEKSGK